VYDRSSGYILLDVLVTLMIASLALVAVSESISGGARRSALQRDKIVHYMELENETVQTAGEIYTTP